MSENLEQKYYERRIEFVVKQYLGGKINYEDIANVENRLKLIKLLNNSVCVSKNIENKLSFQILNDILNKN